MRLATVLTPPTDGNFLLAAQCGVTDFVCRYPGDDPQMLARMHRKAASFGMALSVVEGYLPIERLKLGQDDGRELAAMKALLAQMGDLGVPILCYNFMAGTDWVRTQLAAPERAGAKVTAFRLADVERAVSLSATATSGMRETISAEALWKNLERFLDELLPVAERFGVTLAAHPDDPPLPELLGKARILNSVEGFDRLLRLAPSAHNALCFCQATFAMMGVDIPATIRRFGPHIQYVHFRDSRGTAADFAETFHDNGQTDMPAAMRAYRDIGFTGPLRPDHVPQMYGEDDGEPGYTMQGRLFAYGYIRGLMQATSAG